MLDTFIRYLSNFISCTGDMLIILYFMSQLYQPLFSGKKPRLLIFILGSVLLFFVNLFDLPILNFSFFIFLMLTIAVVFYNARRWKEILQIIIFLVSYAICDIIISSFMSIVIGYMPLYGNNSILYLLNILIVLTFMMIINNLLIILFKKQEEFDSPLRKYILLLILPIVNFITIDIILILPTYKLNPKVIYYLILFMAIISILINISVIYIYHSVSKSDRLERNIALMKQHDNMQYNYYQQLEVEYNNSQKIVHDIKNHIKVIERLYSMDQFSEGLEYAQKIYDIVDQLGMKFKSNNRILNIIVNEKIKLCELYNIKFIYTVENVNLDFISETDITSIFANILDNAIEACLKIKNKDRQVEFRLYHFNEMIVINLINSIEAVPARNGDEFISTKENHKAIGLSNVQACVCKYDGDFDINFEQGKFSISIMLPIKD